MIQCIFVQCPHPGSTFLNDEMCASQRDTFVHECDGVRGRLSVTDAVGANGVRGGIKE